MDSPDIQIGGFIGLLCVIGWFVGEFIGRRLKGERVDIQLGQKVTDGITGFTGIVVGKVTYISGCDQALVSPRVKEDGTHVEAHWYDVQRLVVDTSFKRVVLDNGATPGADKPAPKR